MKNYTLKKSILSAILFALTFNSCNKIKISEFENIQRTDNPINNTDIPYSLPNIKIIDGVLAFDTPEDFNKATLFLSLKTQTERLEWQNNIGIKTQQTIFDEICLAEDEFDNVYFAGIDENVTLEKLKEIGKEIEFSDKYKYYKDKKLIVEAIEEDGSYSFRLNTFDPVASYVLNENGFVIIRDSIYLFNNNNKTISIKRYEDQSDKELLNRNSYIKNDKNIIVFEIQEKNRNQTNSFYIDNIYTNPDSGNESTPTWYYDSSHHRFRQYVKLYSGISSNYDIYLTSRFQTEAIAEQKKWWKWKIRNSFNPIDFIGGHWNYKYAVYGANGYTADDHFNDLSGGAGSGGGSNWWLNPNVMSNHMAAYLNPTGFYTYTYGFVDAVDVTGFQIQGRYYGTTGNYWLTLQK